MKKLLLIILAGIPLLSFCQKDSLPPVVDGLIIYTGVIETGPGVTKDVLYKRAKHFFADTYRSAKDVITFDDSDEVKGTGIISTVWDSGFMGKFPLNIKHTISIKIKDGKYKYEISELRCIYNNGDDSRAEKYLDGKKSGKRVLNKVDEKMKALVNDIQKSMSENSIDW